MVAGLVGQTGRHAATPVGKDYRKDDATVPILPRLIVGESAQVTLQIYECVKLRIVQVRCHKTK